jgi:alkanesulfonate monooxygenase SsuD/methylene tetrahydromethanopterin reductase-like flavin-dependent oxidoreductase (luciferase family)
MLDEALINEGRDPSRVGILWSTQVIVGATADEAAALRDSVLDFWSEDAVGAYLSHNSGHDFSSLPASFVLGEFMSDVWAAGASRGGFLGGLLDDLGADYRMSKTEFFEHGWKHATGLDHTLVGSPAEIADELEKNFAATGARGGYMFSSPLATPVGLDGIADLLVPELRRRGALAPVYPGATLRENLAV